MEIDKKGLDKKALFSHYGFYRFFTYAVLIARYTSNNLTPEGRYTVIGEMALCLIIPGQNLFFLNVT